MLNNLHVRKVKLADGPGPATVWALSCTSYTVSDDNPPIVSINMSLPKLVTLDPSCRIEYCVITPLGGSGGLHCKITEVELTENTTNERGLLGPTMKLIGTVGKLAVK